MKVFQLVLAHLRIIGVLITFSIVALLRAASLVWTGRPGLDRRIFLIIIRSIRFYIFN